MNTNFRLLTLMDEQGIDMIQCDICCAFNFDAMADVQSDVFTTMYEHQTEPIIICQQCAESGDYPGSEAEEDA